MKEDKIGWACITYGEIEKCTQNFGRKTWRERQLGRPRYRWEDIRMDLREI